MGPQENMWSDTSEVHVFQYACLVMVGDAANICHSVAVSSMAVQSPTAYSLSLCRNDTGNLHHHPPGWHHLPNPRVAFCLLYLG